MRLLSEPLQAITPDDIKQLCLDQVSEGTELAASKKAPIIQNATSDNLQWHVYTISRRPLMIAMLEAAGRSE